MKKRLTMLLACFFLMVGGVIAQTKVNGTVTSQEDGQPVIGASVLVVGTHTLCLAIAVVGAQTETEVLAYHLVEVTTNRDTVVTLSGND